MMKITHEISNGSYGNVFAASFPNESNTYAIKKYTNEHKMNGAPAAFVRESNVLSRLQHPNIVHTFRYKKSNGYKIIMELADKTLDDLMDSHVTINYMNVFAQIVRGVLYLHTHNIIHGDLKPANILIFDTVCKIADIDSYVTPKKYRDFQYPITTLFWRAPELLHEQSYTEKIDIWSLGIILYKLLTGKIPTGFSTEELVLNAITKNIETGKYLSQIHYPENRDLIQLMLQVDPDKRANIFTISQHPLVKSQYISDIQPKYTQLFLPPLIEHADKINIDIRAHIMKLVFQEYADKYAAWAIFFTATSLFDRMYDQLPNVHKRIHTIISDFARFTPDYYAILFLYTTCVGIVTRLYNDEEIYAYEYIKNILRHDLDASNQAKIYEDLAKSIVKIERDIFLASRMHIYCTTIFDYYVDFDHSLTSTCKTVDKLGKWLMKNISPSNLTDIFDH